MFEAIGYHLPNGLIGRAAKLIPRHCNWYGSRRTFNFGISRFLCIAYIKHREPFSCLIKSSDEVLEVILQLWWAQSSQGLHKTLLIQEHVDPKLILVRAVSLWEMLNEGVGNLLSSDQTTGLTLNDQFLGEDSTISVDKSYNTVTLQQLLQ